MSRFLAGAIGASTALMMAPMAGACPPSDAPLISVAPQLSAGASADDVASNERAWKDANANWDRVVNEGAEMQRQAGLIGRSESLVLVRLDSIERTGGSNPTEPVLTKVKLKPLRWLSFPVELKEFELVFTDATGCGPDLNRDAWGGTPGDVLVVYLSGKQLRQDNVLDTIAVKHVVEMRALDALTWNDEQ